MGWSDGVANAGYSIERSTWRAGSQRSVTMETDAILQSGEFATDLSLAEARERVIAAAGRRRLDIEKRSLATALGHTLAEAVAAATPVPAYDNSAMDGFALRGCDLPSFGVRELDCVGEVHAGDVISEVLQSGACLSIMTGAALPPGVDTVIKQEDVHRQDGSVRIGPGHRGGENVRRAGEETAVGDCVLREGTRLGPAQLGVLASVGVAEVAVYRRPRVAVLSTGNELTEPGDALRPGHIYDSNRHTLSAMLREQGVEVLDLGVVPDDREALAQALREAARTADAIISSGGVSVGEADYLRGLLAELGEIDFWRVRIKPGRPVLFGRIGETLVFGLPGNPVSSMVTFEQLALPALTRLAGRQPGVPLRLRARLTTPLKKRPGRMDLQRGVMDWDGEGDLRVATTGPQGSARLSSMTLGNCLIVLDEDCGDVEVGETVLVEPLPSVLEGR